MKFTVRTLDMIKGFAKELEDHLNSGIDGDVELCSEGGEKLQAVSYDVDEGSDPKMIRLKVYNFHMSVAEKIK